jgi:Na+/H+ antiporter NhaD/arsenite permease-like protein
MLAPIQTFLLAEQPQAAAQAIDPNRAALAAAVFIVTYGVIVSEKVHKAVAALIGGVLAIVIGLVSQQSAFKEHIAFDVIFLLAGMMIQVFILRKTGLFQWMAIKAVQVSGGWPIRTLIVLSITTAVISAFLDNVTTVLLVAPMTLLVAETLEVEVIPFLIAEVLCSNIGGIATLIGDPTNMLIGTHAGLSFNAFIFNLTPAVVLIVIGFAIMTKLMFRRKFGTSVELRARVLEMDATTAITDRPLLIKGLIVFACVLFGFFFHRLLGVEPATVALGGAAVLMLITKTDPAEAFTHIEWPSLFFFIGLFIVIGGLRETGAIAIAADAIFKLTGGSLIVTVLILIWFSAAASAIIDNIAYVATVMFIVDGLVAGLAKTAGLPPETVRPILFWSLSLGACLGGNATIIGASANVVVSGIAERHGHRISFLQFMRYGVPYTLMALSIGTAYVILRYVVLHW